MVAVLTIKDMRYIFSGRPISGCGGPAFVLILVTLRFLAALFPIIWP